MRPPTSVLVLIVGLSALAALMSSPRVAAAQTATTLPSSDRIAALEHSRSEIVSRDNLIGNLCRPRCATQSIQRAADDLRQLDRDFLPTLDAAITRIGSGQEATPAQLAAVLAFAGREHELVGRLQAAVREPGNTDGGSPAAGLSAAAGQLFAILVLLAIPVGAFVGIRRLLRRRSMASR